MATYYVRTDGNDSNAGTTNSAGGAWLTIGKACGVVNAGDRVWIKEGTYAEGASSVRNGSAASHILFSGFSSTPGDSGIATIDGESSRAYGLKTANTSYFYWVIRNIKVINTTGVAFDFVDADKVTFINCEALDCAEGFDMNASCMCYRCKATGTSAASSHGFVIDNGSGCIFCEASGFNRGFQVLGYVLTAGCLSYDNLESDFYTTQGIGAVCINCTAGGTGTETHGFNDTNGANSFYMNCLSHDATNGIRGNNVEQEARGMVLAFGAANCTNDYNSYVSHNSEEHVTAVEYAGDPFADSASGDFALDASAGADFIQVGADFGGDTGQNVNLGCFQTPSGAAGGQAVPQGLHHIDSGVNA